MRMVLDTNVFISAILGGRLGIILDEWKAGTFTLIVTDVIAAEYLNVISRPKFNLSEEEMISVSDYLLQVAEFVMPEEEIAVVDDTTDNRFLEAAIVGKVDFVVSGDHHLLDLKSFRDISIMTAKEFINWPERQS